MKTILISLVYLTATISIAKPAYAEFSAKEIATMCGGVSSKSFSAQGGAIAYDNNGIRIVGADGDVRIENAGGVLLAKIKKYTADDYVECLAKMRSLDLDSLLKESFDKLMWSGELGQLIAAPEGNHPVLYLDIPTSGRTGEVTKLIFKNMTCEARLWMSRLFPPSRPKGIGGIGLRSTTQPKEFVKVPSGDSAFSFNMHSEFFRKGYVRQQRFAVDNGDRDFAVESANFHNNWRDWAQKQAARLSLGISVPAANCSGRYTVLYPVNRRDIGNAIDLD